MDVSIFELLKTRINYKFSNYLFGNGDKKVWMERVVLFIQQSYIKLSINILINNVNIILYIFSSF